MSCFQINKPSATIVHIVDLFIYIYIALFPGRLYILYGCTLNHIMSLDFPFVRLLQIIAAKKEATEPNVPIG
jgi:hypothetical protein